MSNKCLYCYLPLAEGDFHERCSEIFFGTKKAPALSYSLSEMSELAKQVVERSVTVPGVQPKLSLTLINEKLADGVRNRLTVVGALGGNYIFKPPSASYPELPQNEHLTMRIAEAFGINTVTSSLIRLQSGELSYITKRIDRTRDGEKIHMLDMFQILEAFDKYKGSLERIGRALGAYSANTLLDKTYFFELVIFCFLTGNNDMHLKNFSMINLNGEWKLAPAYDLLNVAIANPSDTEELALTLGGKKKNLKREHFTGLGETLGLNTRQIEGVINRFIKSRSLAFEWIDKSFLSIVLKEAYKSIMNERYKRLEK